MATFNEIKAKDEARKAYGGQDELSIVARNAYVRGFLDACKMAQQKLIEIPTEDV